MQKSKIQKNVKQVLKWVQENAPGVSRAWGGSKLRSESNGRPPGPQNGNKKSKNTKNLENPENPGFPVFFLYIDTSVA